MAADRDLVVLKVKNDIDVEKFIIRAHEKLKECHVGAVRLVFDKKGHANRNLAN